MKKINLFFQNFISFFYPVCCVSCGQALQQYEQHLCLSCLMHLPETHYHKEKGNPLKNIFMGRVPLENVSSLLFYKKGNKVQHILHNLKYKGNKELGSYLGKYFGQQLKESEFNRIDYIIPIPLHPKKLKKRGYNQSEWIAKGLAEGMEKEYLNDVLVRTQYTETQTKKSRFNRWENVKEVFSVSHEEKIEGKHLLLCDDVLTTGATMEAAIQKLLKVKGVTVSVATLACAQ